MNGTYPKNDDFDSVYKDGWDSENSDFALVANERM